MKAQNFDNHSRVVPGYHFATCGAIVLLVIGSFVNLFKSSHDNLYSASLICLAGLIFASFAWYARIFALRAQDRAIRAEEKFRYYLLAGKTLPSELRMSQIIALRFAADEEFIALADRAIAEKLSARDIKAAVKNWRGDYHRA